MDDGARLLPSLGLHHRRPGNKPEPAGV